MSTRSPRSLTKTVKPVEGTYVDDSKIQGRGLFAGRAFEEGATLGVFEGAPTQRDGTHVLWIEEPDGNFKGIRGQNTLRYMNHSSEPNVEFHGTDVRVIQPIASDEEITVHYGEEWDDVE